MKTLIPALFATLLLSAPVHANPASPIIQNSLVIVDASTMACLRPGDLADKAKRDEFQKSGACTMLPATWLYQVVKIDGNLLLVTHSRSSNDGAWILASAARKIDGLND